jgi:diguanylate cyclase (GGDEF)-like protein
VKILVAEDDAVSRRLLEALLVRSGYEVITAADGDEAWAVLSTEDAPQLAILDWVMPGRLGIEVCREVRARTEGPYVYTILLTGRDSKEDVVEGMGAGADDYITKPFDAHELSVRLRAGRRILDLQAQLLAAQDVLRERVTHDPLTGLWSREYVLQSLHEELDRSGREGAPVSVIMADLDHFKDVNDSFGHIAGDAVLREAARRMRSSLRIYDVLGRYGGEEFLILCPGCDASSAVRLADRIRRLIADQPIDTSEGVVDVTISLGTSTTIAGRADAQGLVRAADAAMYRAKAAGRNRVEQAGREEAPGTWGIVPAAAADGADRS